MCHIYQWLKNYKYYKNQTREYILALEGANKSILFGLEAEDISLKGEISFRIPMHTMSVNNRSTELLSLCVFPNNSYSWYLGLSDVLQYLLASLDEYSVDEGSKGQPRKKKHWAADWIEREEETGENSSEKHDVEWGKQRKWQKVTLRYKVQWTGGALILII